MRGENDTLGLGIGTFLSPGGFFELLMPQTSGQCCVGVMYIMMLDKM